MKFLILLKPVFHYVLMCSCSLNHGSHCFLLFTIQHVSCGARSGRGVRAVGVATLNAFFRKKAKDKRKKQAVQMLRTGNI